MQKNIEHAVVIVPGLGDGDQWLSFLVRNWPALYNLQPHMHVMPWAATNEDYTTKEARLLKVVDDLARDFRLVSLIGASGGGSVVINILTKRLNVVHRVVSNCGRAQAGENVRPTLKKAGEGKPAFIESVRQAEAGVAKLDEQDKARILTLRPYFDATVPTSTVTVYGAKNVRLPSVGHVTSIGMAFAFPKMIIEFLGEEK